MFLRYAIFTLNKCHFLTWGGGATYLYAINPVGIRPVNLPNMDDTVCIFVFASNPVINDKVLNRLLGLIFLRTECFYHKEQLSVVRQRNYVVGNGRSFCCVELPTCPPLYSFKMAAEHISKNNSKTSTIEVCFHRVVTAGNVIACLLMRIHYILLCSSKS